MSLSWVCGITALWDGKQSVCCTSHVRRQNTWRSVLSHRSNRQENLCCFTKGFPLCLIPAVAIDLSSQTHVVCLKEKEKKILFQLESGQSCGCPSPLVFGLVKNKATERMFLMFQLNELQGYTQSRWWFGRSLMKSAGMHQGTMWKRMYGFLRERGNKSQVGWKIGLTVNNTSVSGICLIYVSLQSCFSPGTTVYTVAPSSLIALYYGEPCFHNIHRKRFSSQPTLLSLSYLCCL